MVIKATGITKTYGRGKSEVKALKGVNLEVDEGEMFCLVGPNGAGKTTLVRILGTQLRRSSGTVAILNHDLDRDTAKIRANIAVVPQGASPDPGLKVWEHIYYYLMVCGLTAGQAKKATRETLRVLGLDAKAKARVSTLSGGMQRRVLLGMALASPARLLLLDEPTIALDPIIRRQTWELLRDLKRHKTIILTTHSMEEVEALADRVAVIKEGSIIAVGSPRELCNMIPGEKKIVLQDQNLPKETLAGLGQVAQLHNKWAVFPHNNQALADLCQLAIGRNMEFSVYNATLEDAFVHMVAGH